MSAEKQVHKSKNKSLPLDAHEDEISYQLFRHVLGPMERIPISADQYQTLLCAREVLYNLASFEEKFFAISEQFREIEEFVFRTTLSNLLYTPTNIESLVAIGAHFGRLTAAMLSSVRLYLDTIVSHAKAMSNGALDSPQVKAVSAGEYDSSFSYRVMEAIRNHAQHRAFPVQSTSFGQKWLEDQDVLSITVEFYFDVNKIDDDNFKAKTKAEIVALGEPINLRTCVRSYFASVCKMHEEYRKMFKVYREQAEADILNWQNIWLETFPDSKLTAVAACRFKGNYIDKAAEKAFIDPQLDVYRTSLFSKTRSLQNMHKRRANIY